MLKQLLLQSGLIMIIQYISQPSFNGNNYNGSVHHYFRILFCTSFEHLYGLHVTFGSILEERWPESARCGKLAADVVVPYVRPYPVDVQRGFGQEIETVMA